MKRAPLTITESKSYPGMVTVVGPNPDYPARSVREALTLAGFAPGDEVCVVLRSDLDELLSATPWAAKVIP